MKLVSQTVWTLCLCLLINIHESINPEEQNLATVLGNYVKQDREMNQIMLLVDNDMKLPADFLFRNLPINSPTWKVSFQSATLEKAMSLALLQSFSNPPRILFVVITSLSSDQVLGKLSRPINFITNFPGGKRRPNVLIILEVKGKATYEDLFRLMWSKQFLDVTILEFQRKVTKGSLFVDYQPELRAGIQHHFNPFSDTFVKKNYSSRSKLFPDKLHDLHGFGLKVGFFHYPPHVIFTRNSTADIIKIDGPDVRLTNALSKTMNFKVLSVLSSQNKWKAYSCLREENRGFYRLLLDNKLQFIAVQTGTSGCLRFFIETTTNSRTAHYVAVVPIIKEQNAMLSTHWKLYNLMALLTMLILVWLMTRLLHFENCYWSMDDLIRIVLGFTIPREPSALAERIVLGAMLVAFFLHSSVIFTAFTSIHLQKDSAKEINTINQLISSGLKPSLESNFRVIFSKFTDKKSVHLLEKSVQQNMTNSKCLQYLARHKNITCFIRDTTAKWLIQRHADQNGQPVMRIISDSVASFTKGHYMETASPYVKRFDETSLKLAEAGIIYRWEHMFFDKPKVEVVLADVLISDVLQSNVQIRIKIVFVLVFGYTCSLLAYFGEVAVYFCKNFFH